MGVARVYLRTLEQLKNSTILTQSETRRREQAKGLSRVNGPLPRATIFSFLLALRNSPCGLLTLQRQQC